MAVMMRTCPECGEEVEFLDLDFERDCPECGKKLYREADQSCVIWCEYAEECIDDMEERGMVSEEQAQELRQVAKEGAASEEEEWETLI